MKEPIIDTREIKKVYCNEDEQETIITISKTEPDTISIWSCDNNWIKIFKDLMKNNPNSWKCFDGGKNNGCRQGRKYQQLGKMHPPHPLFELTICGEGLTMNN